MIQLFLHIFEIFTYFGESDSALLREEFVQMQRALTPIRALAFALAASPASEAACRSRSEWPFSTTSIWNTPVGTAATYLPANLYGGTVARDSGECSTPQERPETRVSCPGSFGGITRTECEAQGCCFSASPAPDPDGYPWCFAKKHTVGPAEFHNDPDRFVQLRVGASFGRLLSQNAGPVPSPRLVLDSSTLLSTVSTISHHCRTLHNVGRHRMTPTPTSPVKRSRTSASHIRRPKVWDGPQMR